MANLRWLKTLHGRPTLFLILIAVSLIIYLHTSSRNPRFRDVVHPPSNGHPSFAGIDKRADRFVDPQGVEDGSESDSDGSSDDEADNIEQASAEEIAKDWEESLAKGCKMYSMLEGDRNHALPSEWKNYDTLHWCGWKRHLEDEAPTVADSVFYKPVAEGGLGMSSAEVLSQLNVGWYHWEDSYMACAWTDDDGKKKRFEVR